MWKDFFSLSRSEQRAFVVLLSLLGVVISTMIFVIISSNRQLNITIKEYDLTSVKSDINQENISQNTSEFKFRPFNPNDVTIKDLETMGVKSRGILNWKKFLEAGGRFNEPDDLFKIFGLDSSFVKAAVNYMVFNVEGPKSAESFNDTRFKRATYLDLNQEDVTVLKAQNIAPKIIDTIQHFRAVRWFTRKFSIDELSQLSVDSVVNLLLFASGQKHKSSANETFSIEINSADTAMFALLKGIGPSFSRRIVAYRRNLGGFVSVDQLLEVPGISPQLLNDIKPNIWIDNSQIVKININKATLRSMKEHPYLGFYKAKDIVDLRQHLKTIKSVEQLFELPSFKNANRTLLLFYLTTQ